MSDCPHHYFDYMDGYKGIERVSCWIKPGKTIMNHNKECDHEGDHNECKVFLYHHLTRVL